MSWNFRARIGQVVVEQEFSRVMQYATSAMGLLKKGVIPPYPQFYELLYTYATGVNPDLNNRINALYKEAEDKDIDLAERLRIELIRENDVETRLNNVSDQISVNINDVHNAIDIAMTSANTYSGSLEDASGQLTGSLGEAELKALAISLLQQTKKMQRTNQALEQRLAVSKSNINNLQQDLEQVRQESILDPLTRVYNRKGFDQGLIRAIEEAQESKAPLCLIMFDIDHFKSFNDSYGHQTGDQVLRLVATTLKSNIKGQDIGARYGGEEFAAILPNTNLEDASTLADKVRKSIQEKELLKRSTNQKLGRVTASFGVASLTEDDTSTTLIERSDRCLYIAKNAGRNCVINEKHPLYGKTAA